ncbi:MULTISPECIES: SIMPL domain-containing protein [Stenotrophomonas]|uniref:SIMPL domain-containing protein n=1 Tax=Stenotrophomonas TaxID=40323 RepID=UPI001CF5EF4C|nr:MULTISPECIES: SIMPL domain-containing protein [Stenotrophomonas]MCA7023440.1 SIMPL domain-containing protein [Stenotrophomonas acidaminiphila]MCE4076183.1 SIMPL domain-containing protein [Stenotrophomonas acidaminiphila]
MKSTIVLSLLLALAPVLSFAQANSVPSQPHLLVKGQAARTVVPDRFTVEFLAQATDMAPEQARSRVEQNVVAVLAALKKHRALAEHTHASSMSISAENAYEDGKQVFKGTKVVRRVRGSFDDLEKLRGLLADVNAGPGLQITSLRSGYAQASSLRAELKAEAARQSRRSAEGLAAAYGTRITGLYTISDVAPSFAYGVQAVTWQSANEEAGEDAVPPPALPAPAATGVSGSRLAAESLETGTITFTENVYAIFLIAQ